MSNFIEVSRRRLLNLDEVGAICRYDEQTISAFQGGIDSAVFLSQKAGYALKQWIIEHRADLSPIKSKWVFVADESGHDVYINTRHVYSIEQDWSNGKTRGMWIVRFGASSEVDYFGCPDDLDGKVGDIIDGLGVSHSHHCLTGDDFQQALNNVCAVQIDVPAEMPSDAIVSDSMTDIEIESIKFIEDVANTPNRKMRGEVDGLPKFQLIRDFYDELVGPFTVLKPTRQEEKAIIERLEQIEETGVESDEFVFEVETIIATSRVQEVRKYKDNIVTVRYSITDFSSDLVAKFTSSWLLLSYTFVEKSLQLSELSADLMDEESHSTTRWEDVIDFCWNVHGNSGFYAQMGSGCPFFGMWVAGPDDSESFAFQIYFGLSQVFEIETILKSHEELVKVTKAFLRGGVSAAQACARDWRSALYSESEHIANGGTTDLYRFLCCQYLLAKRKNHVAIKRTLDNFGIDASWSYTHPIYLSAQGNSPKKILAHIRKTANTDRSQFTNYRGGQDDWIIDAYLALRGDKPSMRQLAALLGKSPLANYWLRKAKGLPLSTDPIPKPERKRKPRPQDKWQAKLNLRGNLSNLICNRK